jgi:large subunit ribosomal protein L21
MYAVIKTGGKQHRVSEGEMLSVEKIVGSKGDEIVFSEVLMVADEGNVRVGTPVVEGAKVIGVIMEQKKNKKIVVFKMKRRKGYHKKTGHRQQQTSMRIKAITI